MFENFWTQYPRKEAKKAAFKAWNKLTTEQQEKAIQTLPLHVKHWANREREYIPLPSSWLNGWRFDDELGALPQVDARTGLKIVQINSQVKPVEEQVPALAAKRGEKPANIGSLKDLVRKV